MQGAFSSKWTFLLALNVFLLIVGSLMDIFSALIVVVPLIVPIALGYGVSPVHLGIIFLTNLEIGYSTPPVGLNLFISSYRFNRSVVDLYRASLPFLGILLLALALITYVPALSLWLVDLVGGGAGP
jgi:TRAP-type C4-dicarboxylate transport system permease large subunit